MDPLPGLPPDMWDKMAPYLRGVDGSLAGRPAAILVISGHWDPRPTALACHPTPEHLLPLMVAAGAAGDSPGRRTYHDHLMGKAVSGFQFG